MNSLDNLGYKPTPQEVGQSKQDTRLPRTAGLYDRVIQLAPSPWLVDRAFAIRSATLKTALLSEDTVGNHYGVGISSARPFIHLMRGVLKGEGVSHIGLKNPQRGKTEGEIQLGQFDQGYPRRSIRIAVDTSTFALLGVNVDISFGRDRASFYSTELPRTASAFNTLLADQRFLDITLDAVGNDLHDSRERWIAQIRQEREAFFSKLTPQAADLTRKTLEATERVFRGEEVLILGSVKNEGEGNEVRLHTSKQVRQDLSDKLGDALDLPTRYKRQLPEYGAWLRGTGKFVRGEVTVEAEHSLVRVTSESLIGMGSLYVGEGLKIVDVDGDLVDTPRQFLEATFSDHLHQGGSILKDNVWLTNGVGVITMGSNRLTLLSVSPNVTPIGPLFV